MTKIWAALLQIFKTLIFGFHPRAIKSRRYIERQEIFMFDYYKGQMLPLVHTLLSSRRNLIRHYVVSGAGAGLNPHHLFETSWYLHKNPDVAARGANPLEHYLRHGRKESRVPSPFLDAAWYRARMGLADTQLDPLMLYRLARVGGSRQSPTPFFDPPWYLAKSADLDARHDLFEHFIRYGRHELRSPNRFFDPAWYLSRYPDVARAGRGACDHFMLRGSDEDRDPSVLFNTSYYRAGSRGARAATIPLIDYLARGRTEGRQPYDAGALPAGARIAVVFHLYYTELRLEIARYLDSIPKPFDLYISVPRSDAELVAIARRRYPKAAILEVDNEGHDIAPFFRCMSMIFEAGLSYTAICKIHTKKGTTHPTVWRRVLLRSTLRSKYLVAEIVRSFLAYDDLYLACAGDFYVSGWEFIGSNGRQVADMCNELYPGRAFPPAWGFLAGSMFWIRPESLRNLVALVARRRASFRENATSNDGQFSHALERMLGLIATLEKKKVALVRSTGDGPLDFEVDFVHAAASATLDQPHIVLERLARRNPSLAITESGPARRRHWQPKPDAELGVHFVGPLAALNGLGTSARPYLATLSELPVGTSAEEWVWGFDRVQRGSYEAPARSEQPIHVIHLNLDLLYAVSVHEPQRFADLFVEDRYYVLICYFELVSLFPEWLPILERFDEVWCASAFMARAIDAATTVKTRVVRPPMNLDGERRSALRRSRFGLDEDRFVFAYFLDAGSVIGRKNPEALLNAYCDEFDPDEDACCFLKIHYGEPSALLPEDVLRRVSARPDIVLSNDIYPPSELPSLFESIDCYVSPHRSEGLGLTIIEAMNAGKPAVATAYGGAADFITDETAYKIFHRWTEVGEGNFPYPATYIWAEPDVGSLAAQMRHVYANKSLARERGRAGQACVREMFGRERTTRGVRDALDAIWASAGRPRIPSVRFGSRH